MVWLHIIGIHPAGLEGLGADARRALDEAQLVFGSPRHLQLAQVDEARARAWPVPFDVAPVLALRGITQVAVLASGDPFCFGAGTSLAKHLPRGEWRNHPQPSTFALMAGELGWPQERTHCLGLHAQPFETVLPLLAAQQRFMCLLRDGAAAPRFAAWLSEQGWGASPMTVFSQVGGPQAQTREGAAAELAQSLLTDALPAPLAVAFEAQGGVALSRAPGRPADCFANDGQITKSPVRAMTLAALAPRAGELLWDLGAGSGSVSIEWCLAGGRALCVEQHAGRVANIEANIRRYGAKASVIHGGSMAILADEMAQSERADAVFVGGGFDADLFAALQTRLAGKPWRLVVNAVTLDTQAVLIALQQRHGGQLLQLNWAEAKPLGQLQGWSPARPLLQWVWHA